MCACSLVLPPIISLLELGERFFCLEHPNLETKRSKQLLIFWVQLKVTWKGLGQLLDDPATINLRRNYQNS